MAATDELAAWASARGPGVAAARDRASGVHRPESIEGALFLELIRIQVGILHHETDADRRAGQALQIGIGVPGNHLAHRIAKQLLRILEREAGQRCALRILQFHAQVARRGRGVIYDQRAAGKSSLPNGS